MNRVLKNKDGKNYLCIDIGGSKLLTGIVNCQGEILAKEKHLLPASITADSLIKLIVGLCKKYEVFAPVAAGVTIPGLADISINVPVKSYEQAEDMHMVVLHMLVCYFKKLGL